MTPVVGDPPMDSELAPDTEKEALPPIPSFVTSPLADPTSARCSACSALNAGPHAVKKMKRTITGYFMPNPPGEHPKKRSAFA